MLRFLGQGCFLLFDCKFILFDSFFSPSIAAAIVHLLHRHNSVGAYDGNSSSGPHAMSLQGRDTQAAVFSVLQFLRQYDAFTAAVIERSDLQVMMHGGVRRMFAYGSGAGFLIFG